MNREEIRRHILGGWLGKAIGGTLGQPFEGYSDPLDLTFYDPVPTGMVANDDLDLQILSAWALKHAEKPVIDRNFFAECWLKHVDFCWDEYAIALKNFRIGIYPPASGCYDNYFTSGLGSAIRSELWACLAPLNPQLAADYAEEDSCLDHCKEGLYASRFLAALESAAFGTADINTLIDTGLSVIPGDCRLAQALVDVRRMCAEEGVTPQKVREAIVKRWGSDNFTDVVMNIPFVVMALLLGKGDFSRTICLAVNCGYDADCTGATAGAILGIAAPEAIPERWLKPIGRACVINPQITGITPPETLDELTDWVMDIAQRLPKFQPGNQRPYSTPVLHAEFGVRTWVALDDRRFLEVPQLTLTPREFPGLLASIPASSVPANSQAIIKFRFEMKKSRDVLILFNSPENVRIWLDGQYLFGREGGRMAPSFHRCPANQLGQAFLEAGVHELICGISRWTDAENYNWMMGLGDPVGKQFLTTEEAVWL